MNASNRNTVLTRTLEHTLFWAPPLTPVAGALAGGAYFGYCQAQGAPVDHAGWYLAGIPVASAFVFTKMIPGDGDVGVVGRFWRIIAVAGSAVAGPIGYGAGYLAGRL